MSHKTVHDYIPLARSMTADAFAMRFAHPFLFGREVLEEEFRFSTLVTEEKSVDSLKPSASTDVFRIRHWVIAIKKAENAPAQDRIFMGRSESNDICVPHKTVSKLHAYLQRDDKIAAKWFVVDAGSANGTKHNGMRIPARAKVSVVDGDTLVFGRCVFQWMSAKALYERLQTMAAPPPAASTG